MSENIFAKVTRNTHGGNTVELHSSPVRVQNANGVWVDINTEIDTREAYSHTPLVPFDVVFAPRLTDGGAIRFQCDHGTTEFCLQAYGFKGLEQVPFSCVGVIEGNKITYPTEWGRVEYQVTPVGLKETVYIEQDVLGDPSSIPISVDGLVINIDFGFAPISFESDLIAWDARGHSVRVHRSQTGVEIPYTEYVKARLPIVIDPTLTSSGLNQGYIYYDRLGNSKYAYTSQGYDSVGLNAGDDGKGSWDAIYRAFSRFDLTTYKNHTVYGTATYQAYPTATGSQPFLVEQIADWATLDINDFDSAVEFNVGAMSNSTGAYRAAANDIRDRLIIKKSTGNSFIAFRVRAQYETGLGTNGSIGGGSNVNPPKIVFNSYATFTQNTPTVDTGQLTANWVNGGGLVTGDKHRIYYKAGTGYTADQIIADNTYVETASYDATIKDITGLTNGTTYCLVVVDVQNVAGTFYEGARSNVVEGAPSGGGGQIPVTIVTDSARKVTNSQNPVMDAFRKLRQTASMVADTLRRRKVTDVVAADALRKTRVLVSVVADTVRRTYQSVMAVVDVFRKTKVGATSEFDTSRKVKANAVVSADTLRSITSWVVTTLAIDTIRRVRVSQAVVIDSFRRIRNSAFIAADTIRRPKVLIQQVSDTVRRTKASASLQSDAFRKVKVSAQPVIDARRKVSLLVTITSKTKRKVLRTIGFIADTLRFIGIWIYHRNPNFTFTELPNPYSFIEGESLYSFIEETEIYAFTEPEGIYSFKGDSDMYVLRVGEQREVGTTGSSSDGSNFSLSATYIFKDTSGNILSSENARIDGYKAFALISPSQAGRFTVTFTITVTPLDANGMVDPTKQTQIYKEDVIVKVTL